jgi:hypothetical protein
VGTYGLAWQAGLISISVSAELGIYTRLKNDSVCDLAGPFLVEGGDFGVMGVSLAWEVDTATLEEALARGTLALPGLGRWVGIVFSFPILPRGIVLPSGGMTVYATWSWVRRVGDRCGC